MSVTITPITSLLFGSNVGANHLVTQQLPSITVIDVSTFRPGNMRNTFSFTGVPGMTCRLGIFACSDGSSERSAILVLPQSGSVDRIVIGISHGFAQNAHHYRALGWSNPQSLPLIQNVLDRHVISRWGPQVLAGKPKTGLFHIIRAAGNELGPFARNGAFVATCLQRIAQITHQAFSYNDVEAFTYSSGIYDFNSFLRAAGSHLNITRVYNIDPPGGMPCSPPRGACRKQFLSGTTTNARPAGFEFLLLPRWVNEPFYGTVRNSFQYLHNYCMPKYVLHLGLRI